jgi:hypothetical protein
MANKFTRFLVDGILSPKKTPSNFRHATRLFVDDTFRLSPRTKFLYYVRFEIDKTALRSPVFRDRHADEVGLLIKNTDLPKYNFDSVVKNQYNRKKIIYKNFNYEPVNLTFHDDSQGVMNAMWALYYGHYIQDRNMVSTFTSPGNPSFAYAATHYRNTATFADQFRYGLDSDITVDFLKTVSIFTMSRRRFLGYTLVNPKIKSWSHGTMDYSLSEPNENSMTLEYEAVEYSSGNVSVNSPKGFAVLHYDNLNSPLGVFGGGAASLFGDGGVLDGLETVFGDVSSGSAFASTGNFLRTVVTGINTARSISDLKKGDISREITNIITRPGAITRAATAINTLGTSFPKSREFNTGTIASAKNVVPPDND